MMMASRAPTPLSARLAMARSGSLAGVVCVGADRRCHRSEASRRCWHQIVSIVRRRAYVSAHRLVPGFELSAKPRNHVSRVALLACVCVAVVVGVRLCQVEATGWLAGGEHQSVPHCTGIEDDAADESKGDASESSRARRLLAPPVAGLVSLVVFASELQSEWRYQFVRMRRGT